jgi:hypothetical protein
MPSRRIDRYDRSPCPRDLCDHVKGLHRLDGSCSICSANKETERGAFPCAIPAVDGVTIRRGGFQPPELNR